MRKISITVTIMMLTMLLFGGIASAHVVVYPKQVTQGTYEKFTVRVPTEKAVPTVKIEVAVPADVDVSKFEPMQGWSYATTKDATGKVTSVTWTATGSGLSPTEFGEFNMVGKIAATATSLVWKAHQTYQDGSVVDWTGVPTDATPASVTTVIPAPASAASDSANATSDADSAASDSTNAASDTDSATAGTASSLPLYISVVALLLGVASIIISIQKKRSGR